MTWLRVWKVLQSSLGQKIHLRTEVGLKPYFVKGEPPSDAEPERLGARHSTARRCMALAGAGHAPQDALG
jgi:hypothetical protein